MKKNTNKNMQKRIEKICIEANNCANMLASASTSLKNDALNKIADRIDYDRKKILEENLKDLNDAKNNNLPDAMIDRLILNKNRIKDMTNSVRKISKLPDPIGTEIRKWERPNGLNISQIRVPIGVIGIIYESRPNVTVDASSLSLKSGNSIILRGGSESFNSSKAIVESIHEALQNTSIPIGSVQMIDTIDREAVGVMLSMNKYIDLIVPRGGKSLIAKVQMDSKIPTLAHLDGLCHTYVDTDADEDMSIKIAINAKMRRTGICGATETLLCHNNIRNSILPKIIDGLISSGCEIRGDEEVKKLNKKILKAKEEDWSTEYLDSIISIKLVSNVNEAIRHIEKYGSNHTDSIITENKNTAEIFLEKVNSAIVLHNASTQYADGGEFGMGAEMGIATGKLHARGPVGLEQLTTYKYQIRGNGQVRP
ncbi:MAG: Gamma-glutamyl phosphate reductase [Alphaproteobacteria bacterium MarineAlpha9_Bin1]|nr:MAG: Gamma-glutamyl phosphate reductase [Alphaproteobacteria bacterium MarineAlpha9_Bin1]